MTLLRAYDAGDFQDHGAIEPVSLQSIQERGVVSITRSQGQMIPNPDGTLWTWADCVVKVNLAYAASMQRQDLDCIGV